MQRSKLSNLGKLAIGLTVGLLILADDMWSYRDLLGWLKLHQEEGVHASVTPSFRSLVYLSQENFQP